MDLSILDDTQKSAVLDTEGRVLIYAGAGSGKTRVLASRVAYLIESGVPAGEILCITFTKRAAREMANRIAAYSGADIASDVWIGTYHHTCNRILRQYGERCLLGEDFTIYDESDAKSVLSSVLDEMGISPRMLPPDQLLCDISRYKKEMLKFSDWSRSIEGRGSLYTKLFPRILSKYNERLSFYHGLDFDDLLMRTILLFRDYPEVLKELSSKFRYVLVDEYQDSAAIDSRLANELSSFHGNLCVVGDPNQSIYGWRGSDYEIIMDLCRSQKDSRVHVLNTNYRSCKEIVSAAGSLISNNKYRPQYSCAANKPDRGRISYTQYASATEEARAIGEIIRELAKDHKYSDISILCRTRTLVDPIEDELVEQQIPYDKVIGVGFYDYKEIKCALAHLRLLTNPNDGAAIRCIAKHLRRGVGSRSIDKISESARVNGTNLLEACATNRPRGVSGQAWTSLQSFCGLMSDLTLSLLSGSSVVELLDTAVSDGGILSFCGSSPSCDSMLENLKSLRIIASQYPGPASDTLSVFLDDSAIAGSDPSVTDRVQLMTIHQSKGLEFSTVFVPGMEEGILPHSKSLDSNIEEERRLCYVAITRATDNVFLSSCVNRAIFGRTKSAQASRFLQEVVLN